MMVEGLTPLPYPLLAIHLLKFPCSCSVCVLYLFIHSWLSRRVKVLYTQTTDILTTVFAIWSLEYCNNQSCSKGWEWYTGQQYAMSLTGHMTRKQNNAFHFALCLTLV